MNIATINQPLRENLKLKVTQHKDRFIRLMSGRYNEILPLTISYEHCHNKKINLNPVLIETYLRSGEGVAIGDTKDGIRVLGTVRNDYNYNYKNFRIGYSPDRILSKDINFLIDEKLRLPEYNEIYYFDGYSSGNFVVLRNKPLSYVSDYEIIYHYVQEMAEINLSRYSISMQSKINTFLRGDIGSNDMEQIADDLYNGVPYVLTSKKFDPEDNIIEFSNASSIQAFTELKREYQNKIAELNAMLGLDSLGVDKESGVSEAEVNSNKSYQKGNENIYLIARNEPLKRLAKLFEKKYPELKDLKAEYVDSMASELSSIEKLEIIDRITGGGD